MFSAMVAMVGCFRNVKRWMGSAIQIPCVFKYLHWEKISFLRTPRSATEAYVCNCPYKHCPSCHGNNITRLPVLS